MLARDRATSCSCPAYPANPNLQHTPKEPDPASLSACAKRSTVSTGSWPGLKTEALLESEGLGLKGSGFWRVQHIRARGIAVAQQAHIYIFL